jgi:hypothetical protein
LTASVLMCPVKPLSVLLKFPMLAIVFLLFVLEVAHCVLAYGERWARGQAIRS